MAHIIGGRTVGTYKDHGFKALFPYAVHGQEFADLPGVEARAEEVGVSVFHGYLGGGGSLGDYHHLVFHGPLGSRRSKAVGRRTNDSHNAFIFELSHAFYGDRGIVTCVFGHNHYGTTINAAAFIDLLHGQLITNVGPGQRCGQGCGQGIHEPDFDGFAICNLCQRRSKTERQHENCSQNNPYYPLSFLHSFSSL